MGNCGFSPFSRCAQETPDGNTSGLGGSQEVNFDQQYPSSARFSRKTVTIQSALKSYLARKIVATSKVVNGVPLVSAKDRTDYGYVTR
jgi:hypothetical protein